MAIWPKLFSCLINFSNEGQYGGLFGIILIRHTLGHHNLAQALPSGVKSVFVLHQYSLDYGGLDITKRHCSS